MDFSRVGRFELVGILCGLIALASLFLLTWYSIDSGTAAQKGPDDWICGVGNTSCTGWETFPRMRWLLLVGVGAPIILMWILLRGHKLTWAPGELTAIGAIAGLVLIGYNGLLDKPGSGPQEIGVSLDWGYWVALLAGVGMFLAAVFRSQEESGPRGRKAPGSL
jgi:hypothetical protein